MSQPEVVAKLTLDDSEAKKDAEEFGKSLTKLGVSLAAISAAAIAAIAVGIKKSIDAAVEAEVAVKAFNQALLTSGQYSREASESFQEYASSLQKTTGVSDELILKNSALLVSVGKLSGEGLQVATRAALDLAGGLQIDVAQAFDVVTKATQGNVGMLAKYGLEVNKSATDSQKFAQALQFINAQFGGMAASGIQGFSGAMTNLSNSFGDIFEDTGKLFTNSKTLRVLVHMLAQAFDAVSASIQGVGKSGDFLKPVFDNIVAFGQMAIDMVLKPIEAISSFIATGIATIVSGVMTAITPLAGIIDKLFKSDLETKMAELRNNWQATMVGLATETNTNAASISTSLITQLSTFQQSVTAQAQLVTDEIKEIPTALEETKPQTESFFDGFRQGIEEMGKSVRNLGKAVSQTFVNGFSNAFASVGKTLVEGGNMFSSFGKAILTMLGQVAIQMGTFYIAAGFAAMFLNPGQGAGLIAGGAALSVLGGVLMALGGGGGGAAVSASGSTGFGEAPGSTTGSATALANDEERVRPNTGVTVNIQGNVLDRRQTGLEIAQIINESFDTDGVTTRAVSGVV